MIRGALAGVAFAAALFEPCLTIVAQTPPDAGNQSAHPTPAPAQRPRPRSLSLRPPRLHRSLRPPAPRLGRLRHRRNSRLPQSRARLRLCNCHR